MLDAILELWYLSVLCKRSVYRSPNRDDPFS